MEIATWRGLRVFARLALCGIVAVFAFVALSLLLGPSTAHASDDDGDRPGLLGAVTNVLDGATDVVGTTVTEVTSVATTTVEKVVAVAPAPVQPPVTAVTEVVTTVTAPVSDVVSSGVVTTVTEPVVRAVTEIPVVGDVVTGLGADDLIAEVGKTVDTTLETVVDAIDEAGAAVGSPTPTAPLIPLPPLPLPSPTHDIGLDIDLADLGPAVSAASLTSPSAVAAARVWAWTPAASLPSLHALAQAAPTASSAVTAPAERSGSAPPFSGPCATPTSSLGSGGSGSGAWALAAFLPLVAHRAWVRRAGPKDDDVPASPAPSHDVSPD
ncbi:hypothetical protein [Microbacterium sp. SLBN-146]|uniref:hypothetical protein n=1 Tax=Microbacterium sp. SLBN-146 TaxID=2768457 RepID=UPI0011519DC0|nr:hypothetical protein [Microbacterium sp. SLBN-146]TQJ30346.1 hypothetical protein FBY39_0794 [Microbacterium sp. SLBN-146]